jgi:hypothetical protein
MITDRIYENQNLLSLYLVSFLVGLRTYQHPCTFIEHIQLSLHQILDCSYHRGKCQNLIRYSLNIGCISPLLLQKE